MSEHERLVEAVRSEIDEGDIAIAGDTEYLVMLAGGEIHSKHPTFGLAEDALEEIRAQRILAAVSRELAEMLDGRSFKLGPRETFSVQEEAAFEGGYHHAVRSICTILAPRGPLEGKE